MTATKIVEYTLYKFSELSDSSKEKAREWYREGGLDYEWWDCTYEDAKTIAALMGIEVDNIYFSGFSSQGDGAQFTGSYNYAKGGAKAVAAHVGDSDSCKTVKRIAEGLQALQRPNFYQLSARVASTGHHSHEYCTSIEVFRDGYSEGGDNEESVVELLRDYMRWIYRALESQYDYINSDEAVDENIECNEYDFFENGSRSTL